MMPPILVQDGAVMPPMGSMLGPDGVKLGQDGFKLVPVGVQNAPRWRQATTTKLCSKTHQIWTSFKCIGFSDKNEGLGISWGSLRDILESLEDPDGEVEAQDGAMEAKVAAQERISRVKRCQNVPKCAKRKSPME